MKQMQPCRFYSSSRFRNRILDLNQIKSPRAQTIVQVIQTLLRSSRSGGWGCVEQGVKRRCESGVIVQAMVGGGLSVFK